MLYLLLFHQSGYHLVLVPWSQEADWLDQWRLDWWRRLMSLPGSNASVQSWAVSGQQWNITQNPESVHKPTVSPLHTTTVLCTTFWEPLHKTNSSCKNPSHRKSQRTLSCTRFKCLLLLATVDTCETHEGLIDELSQRWMSVYQFGLRVERSCFTNLPSYIREITVLQEREGNTQVSFLKSGMH